MERLTAFEFIAAQRGVPQVVRLRLATGPVLAIFHFVDWIGFDLRSFDVEGFLFDRREDLVIEGQGLGRPYWNDEQPTWLQAFNPADQARQIEIIRAAVMREVNRAQLSLVQ